MSLSRANKMTLQDSTDYRDAKTDIIRGLHLSVFKLYKADDHIVQYTYIRHIILMLHC